MTDCAGDETDVALVQRRSYFAGLIDGEGRVALEIKGGSPHLGHSVPTVTIKMTHKETVEAARDFFGRGSVMPHKVAAGCKPQWRWRVTYNDARFVLRQVLPYLITKKNEAYLVLGHMHMKRARRE